MESNEEYLLRTLHRTSSGLTDSLIPAHGAKLTKLVNKFESADTVTGEVNTLMSVQGFGKCALAMEWLLERTQRSNDYFSPEQFESDVLLLNEKLFEAFLNQPFDMPDFSRTFEAPVRPIQNIHLSDDEFIGTSYPAHHAQSSLDSLQEQTEEPEPAQSFIEPTWDTSSSENSSIQTPMEQSEELPVTFDEPAASVPSWETQSEFVDPLESALRASSAEHSGTATGGGQAADSSPSLKDSMTPDLFEASERVAQTAVEFLDKSSSDRPVAMAVFRVTVRAASESAKSSANLIAQDLFEALLKLIAYTDEQGKIKTDTFAHIIRDAGDRLTIALSEPSGGITLLKNLTNYIKDPKELFAKG
ncbi:MAG: hypothetical protein M0R68_05950 [Bacteroidetes bacterium]|nr:hypothetical protein [Bacteroidota bacterium]